ncbi:MAG: hypothetical protein ACLGG0_12415 [Bacteriovoracia bacterium]
MNILFFEGHSILKCLSPFSEMDKAGSVPSRKFLKAHRAGATRGHLIVASSGEMGLVGPKGE